MLNFSINHGTDNKKIQNKEESLEKKKGSVYQTTSSDFSTIYKSPEVKRSDLNNYHVSIQNFPQKYKLTSMKMQKITHISTVTEATLS